MNGRPVTIRLLGPPLHEFLRQDDVVRRQLAEKLDVPFDFVIDRIKALMMEYALEGEAPPAALVAEMKAAKAIIEAEAAELAKTVAHAEALRAQFKQGTHAKTAEGQVGVLTMDPDSDDEVKLRLADGTRTGYVKVGTLSEPSAEELAVHDAATKASTTA